MGDTFALRLPVYLVMGADGRGPTGVLVEELARPGRDPGTQHPAGYCLTLFTDGEAAQTYLTRRGADPGAVAVLEVTTPEQLRWMLQNAAVKFPPGAPPLVCLDPVVTPDRELRMDRILPLEHFTGGG